MNRILIGLYSRVGGEQQQFFINPCQSRDNKQTRYLEQRQLF